MDAYEILLNELARDMNADERLILCGFHGDPNTADPKSWRPRPWKIDSGIPFMEKDNAYVTVASFYRAGDGSFRRRGASFAAGRALMVDDVGTKVPREVVAHAEPTFKIETSPGNEQWWYLLEKPERDQARFDGLIRAFISAKLLGEDPGMSGVTRVGRLPGFTNGKAKYNGFVTRFVPLALPPSGKKKPPVMGARWSQAELMEAFKLTINGRREIREKLPTELALQRNRMFESVYLWLDQNDMLKKKQPDPSGWTEMRCPWVADHTDKADTGAAIREPNPENDYYGAFRCHHGHCAEKGWAELTEWIAEESAAALEAAAE